MVRYEAVWGVDAGLGRVGVRSRRSGSSSRGRCMGLGREVRGGLVRLAMFGRLIR